MATTLVLNIRRKSIKLFGIIQKQEIYGRKVRSL